MCTHFLVKKSKIKMTRSRSLGSGTKYATIIIIIIIIIIINFFFIPQVVKKPGVKN